MPGKAANSRPSAAAPDAVSPRPQLGDAGVTPGLDEVVDPRLAASALAFQTLVGRLLPIR